KRRPWTSAWAQKGFAMYRAM
ncbi:hypothetical protein, partial [Escherichia coli]